MFAIPLTLGVVAAALIEIDGVLITRLYSSLITIASFSIASVSVEILFPYPYLFLVGLIISTSCFILLGGLGKKYAAISFSSLLVSIYTMLGVTRYEFWYEQPCYLLIGASWYILITLLEYSIFPNQGLHTNIADNYRKLATCFIIKAKFFNFSQKKIDYYLLHDLSLVNFKLIQSLNQNRNLLSQYLKKNSCHESTKLILYQYSIIQDIHERINSVHIKYLTLRKNVFCKDLIKIFQQIFYTQSDICIQISKHFSIFRTCNKTHLKNLLLEADVLLTNVIKRLSRDQYRVLDFLLKNLYTINSKLLNFNSKEKYRQFHEENRDLLSSSQYNANIGLIKLDLNEYISLNSPLFRHAMRLSISLCTGYVFTQITGFEHGYWIMLTTLFVCQSDYNATYQKIEKRILGTFGGIVIGLPILLITSFSTDIQLTFIVISGMLFFTFRKVKYDFATMFATVLVLLFFNLMGEGLSIAIPRIIDTLIGCVIVLIISNALWPEWKFRNFSKILDYVSYNNFYYLKMINDQYHTGYKVNQTYYSVYSKVWSSHEKLASFILHMENIPKISGVFLEEKALHLFYLNHTLTSSLGVLSIHRGKLLQVKALDILNELIFYLKNNQPLLKKENTIQEKLVILLSSTEFSIRYANTKEFSVLQEIKCLISTLIEIQHYYIN